MAIEPQEKVRIYKNRTYHFSPDGIWAEENEEPWAGLPEKENGHVPFSSGNEPLQAYQPFQYNRRDIMAESQSRYSIVDELMDKKNSANEEIVELKARAEKKQLELKRLKEDYEQFQKDVKRRITMLEEKKKNIDEAIQAIQNISKESTAKKD